MKLENDDDELMVMAAHGYCLGRKTYIAQVCIFWLISHWESLSTNTRGVIIRGTKRAIQRGEAGDECDRDAWQKLVENCG